MTFPEHERQDAEAALDGAYELLTDFIDVAMDAGHEQAQIDGQEVQESIQSLLKKYARS